MTPLSFQGDLTIATFNFGEVHNESVDLLALLEGKEVGIGLASLALSMARLLSPEQLTDKEEVKFIQDCLEWGGVYFAGKGN